MPTKPGGGGNIQENYDETTGRYTKNTNAGPNAEITPITSNENVPYNPEAYKAENLKNYNKENTIFDKNVSEPCFSVYVRNALLPAFGGKSVFKKATDYEDLKLGVDFFVGTPGTKFKYLLDDPNVDAVDLKTVKGGLGNREFYDHPQLVLTLYKMSDTKTHKVSDLLHKNLNSHFAFQVLYSPKSASQVKSYKDIQEAKFYYVSSSAMRKYVDQNVNVAQEGMEIFTQFKDRPDIRKELFQLAQKNGYEAEDYYDETKKEDYIVLTNKETGIAIRFMEDSYGVRQVKFEFPSRIIKQDPELRNGSQANRITFGWNNQ